MRSGRGVVRRMFLEGPRAVRPWLLRPFLALAVAAVACLPALAQDASHSVSVNGVMGQKALLVIDGSTRMMSVGSSAQGVRVLAIDANEVTVEIGGRKVQLPVGGSPVNVGGSPSSASGTRIVLPAGSGGHFAATGSINGRNVQFIVDTGASLVTISQSVADRIGLDYRHGQALSALTANGAVQARRVSLNVVRVGDVNVYNVEAIVLPTSMDMVLLGNSYLAHFQMKRENDQMVLDKRF